MKKVWVIVPLALLAFVVTWFSFAVTFQGFYGSHFNSNNFKQLELVWNKDHSMSAVVARREDSSALNSPDVFVMLGTKDDYRIDELRRAFIYKKVVVIDHHDNPGNNIHLQWKSNMDLNISCSPCIGTPDGMVLRRSSFGPVHLTFIGFPENGPYTETSN